MPTNADQCRPMSKDSHNTQYPTILDYNPKIFLRSSYNLGLQIDT
ncbi:526_t:CDS:2 [Cetraspora pellucida]|uniref:526_t:CDS:1 n=1 Tax=Cetraspora pellucida TaxID=1433469 RepID=A0A9N9CV11_9GLOM|nr:526_t:CDS:2 [Cetraspora pellucida]